MNKRVILKILSIIGVVSTSMLFGLLAYFVSIKEVDVPLYYLFLCILYIIIWIIVIEVLAIKWNCVTLGTVNLINKKIKGIKELKYDYNYGFTSNLNNNDYLFCMIDNLNIYYKLENKYLNIFIMTKDIYKYDDFDILINNIKEAISKIEIDEFFNTIHIGIINNINNKEIDNNIYDLFQIKTKLYIKSSDTTLEYFAMIVPFIVDNKTNKISIPNYVNGPMINKYKYFLKIFDKINNL